MNFLYRFLRGLRNNSERESYYQKFSGINRKKIFSLNTTFSASLRVLNLALSVTLLLFDRIVAVTKEQELVEISTSYIQNLPDPVNRDELNDKDEDRFLKIVTKCNSYLEKPYDSSCIRDFGKSLAFLFGSTAGIPLIVLAEKASGNHQAFGLTLACSTVFSIGVSRSWGLLQLISEDNLLKLQGNNKGKFYAKIAFSHITGLISSLPLSYTVYNYNRGITKYLTISTLLAEYGIATYGYMEIFSENIWGFCKLLNFETHNSYGLLSQNCSIEKNLISALENAVCNLTYLHAEKQEKINQLTESIDLGNVDDFFKILLDINREEEFNSFHKTLAKLMVCAIPLSNAFQNAIMSLNAAKDFNNSFLFGLGYTFVSVTPSLILGTLTSRETASDVYDSIFSQRNKNLLNTYHPNLYKSIITLALMSSCLTASGSMFLCYDIIKNSILGDLAVYFAILNGIGIVIFESYVIRLVLENLSLMHFKVYGSEEEKKLLKIKERAEKLHLLLKYRSRDWNE